MIKPKFKIQFYFWMDKKISTHISFHVLNQNQIDILTHLLGYIDQLVLTWIKFTYLKERKKKQMNAEEKQKTIYKRSIKYTTASSGKCYKKHSSVQNREFVKIQIAQNKSHVVKNSTLKFRPKNFCYMKPCYVQY